MIALMLTLAELRSVQIGLSMVPHADVHDRVDQLLAIETRLGEADSDGPCYTVISGDGVAFSTYRPELAVRLEAAVADVLHGADQGRAVVYQARPNRKRRKPAVEAHP